MAAPDDCYHAGMRGLQDRFDTHRLADRLAERLSRERFTDEDRAFIESRTMFFLSTADGDGAPDCSYKGGDPGFVKLLDDTTLVFPSYDGNGMFRSLGNITVNPRVGLLFIDWERPRRLRVSGEASLVEPDATFPGRATHRAGARAPDLPQLPALHPSPGRSRALGVRPARRARGAGAGVEALRDVRRRVAGR